MHDSELIFSSMTESFVLHLQSFFEQLLFVKEHMVCPQFEIGDENNDMDLEDLEAEYIRKLPSLWHKQSMLGEHNRRNNTNSFYILSSSWDKILSGI